MLHSCFHLVSENKSEFLTSIEDVKIKVKKWKDEGDSHVKVFKITTEDLGSDAISLDEKELEMDETKEN